VGKRVVSFLSSLALGIIGPLLILVPRAYAAVVTWDGEGADNNWSTAANWSGDTAPVNGDSIVLPRSILTSNEVLNNDISSLSLAGISVTGTGTYYYTVNGNGITLTGDITVEDYTSQINTDLTIGSAGVRIQKVSSTGSLNIGSNATTIENSYFDGSISGSAALTIDVPSSGGSGGGCGYGAATAQYPFKGDNSGFSGSVTLSGYASLAIPSVASTLANHASSITVGPNAGLGFSLSNGQDYTFSKPITLNGGSIYAAQLPADDTCADPAIKTLTLSGAINATTASEVYMVNVNVTMSGSVTGASNISVPEGNSAEEKLTIGTEVKQSAFKTTTVTGDQSANNYSAPENNLLIVSEGAKAGTIFVSGGTLKGVGTVGMIALTSGKVAPGLSPGCLNSGALSYSGGSLDIELAGTTACTEYDQQVVTGAVSLGSATTLNVSMLNDYKPALNSTYTIINNDAADAVTGTFSGLAEGATFQVSGYTFRVNYAAGDGNDVVLTVTAVPASAPDTGVGSLLGNPIVTIIAALLAGAVLVANRYAFSKVKK
jgi:hypothetical protein